MRYRYEENGIHKKHDIHLTFHWHKSQLTTVIVYVIKSNHNTVTQKSSDSAMIRRILIITETLAGIYSFILLDYLFQVYDISKFIKI